MNQELTLHFPFQDQTLDLSAELTDEQVSPHTGRTLRQAQSQIRVVADSASAFREALDASPATDADGHPWTGRVGSESYSNGGPHSVSIEWEEGEELQAELVRFAGLELTPSSYDEPVNEDGVLALEFQATLSPEETDRLRELQTGSRDDGVTYWPVVRVGVSEEPKRMRFGRVVWNQREDGNVEHKIVLVEDEQAESGISPFLKIGQPQLDHAVGGVADIHGQFDALLAILEQGKTIDAEAIQQIRDAGKQARRTRGYTFYEVGDVSEW